MIHDLLSKFFITQFPPSRNIKHKMTQQGSVLQNQKTLTHKHWNKQTHTHTTPGITGNTNKTPTFIAQKDFLLIFLVFLNNSFPLQTNIILLALFVCCFFLRFGGLWKRRRKKKEMPSSNSLIKFFYLFQICFSFFSSLFFQRKKGSFFNTVILWRVIFILLINCIKKELWKTKKKWIFDPLT